MADDLRYKLVLTADTQGLTAALSLADAALSETAGNARAVGESLSQTSRGLASVATAATAAARSVEVAGDHMRQVSQQMAADVASSMAAAASASAGQMSGARDEIKTSLMDVATTAASFGANVTTILSPLPNLFEQVASGGGRLSAVWAALGGPIGAAVAVVGAVAPALMSMIESVDVASQASTSLRQAQDALNRTLSGGKASVAGLAEEYGTLSGEALKVETALLKIAQRQSHEALAKNLVAAKEAAKGALADAVGGARNLWQDKFQEIDAAESVSEILLAYEAAAQRASSTPEVFRQVAASVAAAAASERDLQKQSDGVAASLETVEQIAAGTYKAIPRRTAAVEDWTNSFDRLIATRDKATAATEADPLKDAMAGISEELDGQLEELQLRAKYEGDTTGELEVQLELLRIRRQLEEQGSTNAAEQAEQYEGQVRAIVAAGKGLQGVQDASAELNTRVGKAFQETATIIERGFKDAFKDAFTDGEGGFERMLSSFESMFMNTLADLAWESLAKPILIPVMQSIGGGLGLSQAATNQVLGVQEQVTGASGAGASTGGLLSGLSSAYDAVTGGLRDTAIQFAQSNLGQSLGLSMPVSGSGMAAAGSFRAAQEAGLSTMSPVLTGAGNWLADGLAASPWGIIGSLGVSALGWVRNPGIGSTIGGMAGSVAGGAAGSAAFGATLGAAAGPIGAILGAALGTVLGGLFGGGKKHPGAGYEAEIGPDGVLRNPSIKSKHMGTEEVEQLGAVLGTYTQALSDLLGGGLTGNVGASIDQSRGRVAFLTRGGSGVGLESEAGADGLRFYNFDPKSEESQARAMARLTLDIAANAEGLTDVTKRVIGNLAVAAKADETLSQQTVESALYLSRHFEDVIKQMKTGVVDLRSAIKDQAGAAVDELIDRVETFQTTVNTAFGATSGEAAVAKEALQEAALQFAGLSDAADQISEVDAAFADIAAKAAELPRLFAAVGFSAEQAATLARQAFAEAMDEATTNGIDAIRQQFGLDAIGGAESVGVTVALSNAFVSLRDAMVEAGASAADLARVTAAEGQALVELQQGFQGNLQTELLRVLDPRGADLADLAAQYAARRRQAEELGVDTALLDRWYRVRLEQISGETEAIRESVQTIGAARDEWRQLNDVIRKSRASALLDTSISPLSPGARLREAESQFNDALGRALDGDKAAIQELPELRKAVLDAAKAQYGATEAYAAIFQSTDSALGRVEAYTSENVSVAERQLATLAAQLGVSQDSNDLLEALLEAVNGTGSFTSPATFTDWLAAAARGMGYGGAFGDGQFFRQATPAQLQALYQAAAAYDASVENAETFALRSLGYTGEFYTGGGTAWLNQTGLTDQFWERVALLGRTGVSVVNTGSPAIDEALARLRDQGAVGVMSQSRIAAPLASDQPVYAGPSAQMLSAQEVSRTSGSRAGEEVLVDEVRALRSEVAHLTAELSELRSDQAGQHAEAQAVRVRSQDETARALSALPAAGARR